MRLSSLMRPAVGVLLCHATINYYFISSQFSEIAG